MAEEELFGSSFLEALKHNIQHHHLLYPTIPPRDIFLESLVEKALGPTASPKFDIAATTRNAPSHDLVVGTERISVKSETGAKTHRQFIKMTKLCTTEKNPWDAKTLKDHVIAHLSRYDRILSVRAIWNHPIVDYQIVEIPVKLLRHIENCDPIEVGRRQGRKSLGADVFDSEDQFLFHVHFDGADGKCQVSKLSLNHCRLLSEWEYRIRD